MTEKVSAEQARDTWNSIRFIVGLYQDHPDAVRLDRYFAQAAAAPPLPADVEAALDALVRECVAGWTLARSWRMEAQGVTELEGTTSTYREIQERRADVVRAALSSRPTPEQVRQGHFDVVFDGPPSHEAGRFVEVEDENRAGMSIGEWVHRDDGFWVLRIPRAAMYPLPDAGEKEAEGA